jgi:hypothetical protein
VQAVAVFKLDSNNKNTTAVAFAPAASRAPVTPTSHAKAEQRTPPRVTQVARLQSPATSKPTPTDSVQPAKTGTNEWENF